jgi:hypothetical protein
MMDENAIRIKLLSRVLSGADPETAKLIMSMGSEMTLMRLLVAVSKIDPHLSVGLLVLRYGVTTTQAKKARNEANKKMED